MDSVVPIQKRKLLRRRKFRGVSRAVCRKSFALTVCWNLAKLVKFSIGIIAHLHHTDQKPMVLRKELVRRVKKGTSAVLLQSGLDERWWADSMECFTYLRSVQGARDCLTAPSLVPRKHHVAQCRHGHADFDRFSFGRLEGAPHASCEQLQHRVPDHAAPLYGGARDA